MILRMRPPTLRGTAQTILSGIWFVANTLGSPPPQVSGRRYSLAHVPVVRVPLVDVPAIQADDVGVVLDVGRHRVGGEGVGDFGQGLVVE